MVEAGLRKPTLETLAIASAHGNVAELEHVQMAEALVVVEEFDHTADRDCTACGDVADTEEEIAVDVVRSTCYMTVHNHCTVVLLVPGSAEELDDDDCSHDYGCGCDYGCDYDSGHDTVFAGPCREACLVRPADDCDSSCRLEEFTESDTLFASIAKILLNAEIVESRSMLLIVPLLLVALDRFRRDSSSWRESANWQ